ncbi:MAG: hypothetical protein EZS28_049820, partial [Streblomastix strix]
MIKQIRNAQCECDSLGKSPFTISECQKTKICIDDDIPEGCTCALIAERSVSGCENNTTLCKELPLELLKVQNEQTCQCFLYGDPRNGSGEVCFEQTNSCESGSSQQLQNIPIQLCECLAIGDVRSEQCSDSIPCESASKEELMGVSSDICDCVSIGDPRDQCMNKTTSCDDSDIDLSDVPISRCECQSHDDERAGKSLSGYNCPGYCNDNEYTEGCACDSSKENYNQCIADKLYPTLRNCNEDDFESVQANTCKCKGTMSPSGCTCPRESSNLIDIPIDICQCVDNDVRAGISCPITSECTDDQINPKCLCTYNHQGSGCICTQSIHPQECECDS